MACCMPAGIGAIGDATGPDIGKIGKIALGVGLIVWALSGITYQPRRSS